MAKFEMHEKVKDIVSGAVGIVVGRMEWDNGCIRYVVQQPIGKDGKVPDSINGDEQNLVSIDKTKARKPAGRTGGPPVYGDPKKRWRGHVAALQGTGGRARVTPLGEIVKQWQCDACFGELPEELLTSPDRFPKCPHCGWPVWRPEDVKAERDRLDALRLQE